MKDREFAKMGNCVVYIALVILAIVVGFAREGLPQLIRSVLVVYFIITVLFLDHLTKDESVDKSVHAKFSAVFFIIVAVVVGLEADNACVYLLMLSIPVFTMLFYLDYKLFDFLECVIFGHLTILAILGFPGMQVRPSFLELVIYYLVMFAANWTLNIFTKSIVFQERKSYEQERSLDDMIKVVSAKCEEARSATRSKSNFLSNMSHEIRTPINAILGMNEMILRESSDRKVLEYASNIDSSGKMLLSLINDILDFSKIESGKMELVNVEYQISSVLNDLVNMIKPKAIEKQLDFKIEVNPNMPGVLYGDEVRIRQIITNLLTNAVKYTDSGEVVLKMDFNETMDKQLELVIEVKDTGRGIKDEDREKLFESFKRIEQERNCNIEGTGLGLTIIKRFIDMMNGMIEVESKYGEGSVFTVHVKQEVRSDNIIGDFNRRFDKSQSLANEIQDDILVAPDASVLVVDDNSMNIEVVRGLLSRTKMSIDDAASGMICIEKVRKNHYDIILLDHMMPQMDGIETLAKMHEEGIVGETPVIALTANAVSGAREMYFEAGFSDYLSKPISGRKLEEAIRKWLDPQLIQSVDNVDDTNLAVAEMAVSTGTQSAIQSMKALKANTRNMKENYDALPLCIDREQAEMYTISGLDGIVCNIRLYIDNVDTTRERLVDAYENDNYSEYGIYAHSLKSTSATIGVMELSSLAEAMEHAGNDGDSNYIKVHHQQMIQMYDDIVQQLKVCIERYETDNAIEVSSVTFDHNSIDVTEDDKMEKAPAEVADIIHRLRRAAEDFDSVLVDNILEELSGFRFSDRQMIDYREQANNANDECEYQLVADIAKDMQERLQHFIED